SLLGCGSGKDDLFGAGGGAGATGSGGGLPFQDGALPSQDAFAGGGTLPPGFTRADSGGWKLGDPVPPSGGTGGSTTHDGGADGCGTVLRGITRDFQDTHPDFEHYCCGDQKGLVADTLGSDLKPVYAPSGGTKFSTGPDAFNQWYRTVDGINKPYFIDLA